MADLEAMEDGVAMEGMRLQDITVVMVAKVETAVVRGMVGEGAMEGMDNSRNNSAGLN
ncbi:hypothetical protein LDT72_002638 [Salmonella enterica]|nr:hypothetical protein [Salmonella enterica]EGV2900408.1 hypothetical protein [Salmonella enterica]EIE7936637.1 hypothetical protein [Salmonella enterica]